MLRVSLWNPEEGNQTALVQPGATSVMRKLDSETGNVMVLHCSDDDLWGSVHLTDMESYIEATKDDKVGPQEFLASTTLIHTVLFNKEIDFSFTFDTDETIHVLTKHYPANYN